MRIRQLAIPTLTLSLTLGLLALPAQGAEESIRLGGATSLAKAIKAQQAKIEAQGGVKMVITPNGSAQGLADLQAGKVDLAMTGGPIAGLVDEYNKKYPNAPTPLKAEPFQDFPIMTSPLKVIVNSELTQTTLTTDQFRDILTGKITNWNAVGGSDMPINVVLPTAGDGGRTQIQYQLLKDQTFTARKREAQLQPEVVKIVAQLPGAISFVSAQNANDTVKTIKLDTTLEYTLSLVTTGEPTAQQKAVIEAVKANVGK